MNSKAKPTLLILEDDSELQILLAEYYTPRGFNILPFEKPEAALTYLRSSNDEVDVVLCDVNLPQMDGLKFVEKAKAIYPDLPIILMTADNAVEIALQAITAGAYDFVVKPLHFTQVTVSIRRAIHLTKLNRENHALKTVAAVNTNQGATIIAKSSAMRTIVALIDRVANSAANILITGESGSGKEVVARTIHQKSPRKDSPFIALNCSAIPDTLLESELFGYAKGAFTGANDSKPGLFEEAQGGTLFLDEIGDLEFQLQAKLLRVLQDRQIKRVGENQYRPIDVRIITATHKDLTKEVTQSNFREDLFYRLNVIPLYVPPLRERPEDIPLFAQHFLQRFNILNGAKIKGFTNQAMRYILTNRWNGNVRELENSIERAVVLCDKEYIDLEHIRFGSGIGAAGDHSDDKSASQTAAFVQDNFSIGDVVEEKVVDAARVDLDLQQPITQTKSAYEFSVSGDRLLTLDEMILKYVDFVMNQVNGVKEKAARILDVDRKTLYRRLADLEQASTAFMKYQSTKNSNSFEKSVN